MRGPGEEEGLRIGPTEKVAWEGTAGIPLHISPPRPRAHTHPHTFHTTASQPPPSDQREPVLLPGLAFSRSSIQRWLCSPPGCACNPKGMGATCAIPRMLLALSRWSPLISHVHFNDLHTHQPRPITTLTDGPVG